MSSRTERVPLDGLIVVDKPTGLSSAAVVERVRARLGVKRAGHTGTLDPAATGVLPICLGAATKLAGYLIAEDKAYRTTLVLGVETDSYDGDGAVTARDEAAVAAVTRAAIDAAIARRIGPQLQEPPLYSAIKVGGRRMHAMARAGEPVERALRPVTIHSIRVIDYAPPRLVLELACSKGTYVRSLAHDVGRDLGCGAHVGALRRTFVDPFAGRAMATVEAVAEGCYELLPVDAGLGDLPAVQLDADATRRLRMGQPVDAAGEITGVCRVYADDGRLAAIGERAVDGTVRPLRVMVW